MKDDEHQRCDKVNLQRMQSGRDNVGNDDDDVGMQVDWRAESQNMQCGSPVPGSRRQRCRASPVGVVPRAGVGTGPQFESCKLIPLDYNSVERGKH